MLRTDIRHFYETIDLRVLEDQLRAVIADQAVFDLLHQSLYRTVERGGLYRDITRGLARGNPLSPVLGALYLKGLDQRLGTMGTYYVRYMDDILLLTRTHGQLRRAVRVLNEQLNALRLEKHPDKTFIGRIERGFDFLGYAFSRAPLRLARQTLARHDLRRHRLYEQQSKKKATSSEVALNLEAYAMRWRRWCRAGLNDLIPQGDQTLFPPMAAIEGCYQRQSG